MVPVRPPVSQTAVVWREIAAALQGRVPLTSPPPAGISKHSDDECPLTLFDYGPDFIKTALLKKKSIFVMRLQL
jgi:hypothetical protein